MNSCLKELAEKENDERIAFIKIHGNRCPVCKKQNTLFVSDWDFDIYFNTQKRAYACSECGYVAKERHKW